MHYEKDIYFSVYLKKLFYSSSEMKLLEFEMIFK